jgi:murein tripeptide amidase MpaA
MSTLYLIHKIVEHADENEDILDHVEFLVIPVVNPGEMNECDELDTKKAAH